MSYTKYPRTLHAPWSEGITNDDKAHKNMDWFEGRDVIVTVKMDGENTTMYNDHIHARSIDSRNHPSRNWVKNFWAGIRFEIPDMWRVCGENMFAEHSIRYDDLESYFLGFSIWNHQNICLSWPKTMEWLEALDITPVELLHYGVYDEETIRGIGEYEMNHGAEGYVIRPVDCFHLEDFGQRVAKVVRKGHVQTDKHWMASEVIPNGLAK
jgi:hypothetical protein